MRLVTGKAKAKRKLVLAFGETLWDLLPDGAVLGGAPFNFAYRLNSLGDRGVIVTRLGNDVRGDEARQRMHDLGMETDLVQSDSKHPTGTVRVRLDERRNPDYTIVPEVAYDYVAPSTALTQLATKADCICFGTLAQRSTRTRRTLRQVLTAANKAVKVLDINLRRECFSPATIEESLDRADMLKMNLQEAHHLADLFEFSDPSLPAFCEEMVREWSLSHCIVTLGEHGVLAANQAGEMVYEPGFRVAVKDTLGAGDAFTAGFIHKHLRAAPLRDCCRFGNALGALVSKQKGATTPVNAEEIERFIGTTPPVTIEHSLQRFAA